VARSGASRRGSDPCPAGERGRGNGVGAVQLLRRAAERIEGYAGDPPHGIAATRLVGWARSPIGRIEQEGLAALTQDDLTTQLRS
jgi:hypothetical protein